MNETRSIAVVGESLAGVTAARELRRLGHRGELAIIGDECHGAYNRPPLSKQVLDTGRAYEAPALAVDGIDAVVVRDTAVGLDLDRKRVRLASGGSRPFDIAVVATGASARRLAGPGQRGEIVLRTLDDARRIRELLRTAASAVVVGGGFLGMEVVSACVRSGVAVTVVDVEPPLRRLLGPFLSSLALDRAKAAGVRVRVDPGGVTMLGDPVRGVRFGDGGTLTADLVVTCAGDVANTSWLGGSGLEIAGGVVIDETGRTGHPDVYAAGDVVTVRTGGGLARRPFWSNAARQGRVAAHGILGAPGSPPVFDDYFWTEILGGTIKIIGTLPPPGEPQILEGDLERGAVLCWPGSETPTVVAWNLKRPLPRLRALAAARTTAG
ncbi:FAD-dependent oxidoreductase [Actinomadura barringtoniae]|uniref:FAD-dependent oxidoreductase n=1 Tax=Actinomadura barringtoniae TaxID=1427535 RepID=A0A939P884_9ACTN|nr:FAD-dependent oxidoreductase [Actinomadura barringtoniae]MBO2447671.1 FAD-dependent oxidoreductase [Actinomadura barringtoniae]